MDRKYKSGMVLPDVGNLPQITRVERDKVDVPTETTNADGALGIIVFVVASVIGYLFYSGLRLTGVSLLISMLSGVLLVVLFGSFSMLIITNTLAHIIRGKQREKTYRYQIDAEADIIEKWLELQMIQSENERLLITRDALPSDITHQLEQVQEQVWSIVASKDTVPDHVKGKNFLPAYDNTVTINPPPGREKDTTADMAMKWAMQLYDATGKPDPQKVTKSGHIRITVIGSKNDKTLQGGEMRDWLVSRGILVQAHGSHNYLLNVENFPRRHHLLKVS